VVEALQRPLELDHVGPASLEPEEVEGRAPEVWAFGYVRESLVVLEDVR
jgi:hypothetical protein